MSSSITRTAIASSTAPCWTAWRSIASSSAPTVIRAWSSSTPSPTARARPRELTLPAHGQDRSQPGLAFREDRHPGRSGHRGLGSRQAPFRRPRHPTSLVRSVGSRSVGRGGRSRIRADQDGRNGSHRRIPIPASVEPHDSCHPDIRGRRLARLENGSRRRRYAYLPEAPRRSAGHEEGALRLALERGRITIPDQRLQQVYDWVRINAEWLVRDVPGIGRGISGGFMEYPWWFGTDGTYSAAGAARHRTGRSGQADPSTTEGVSRRNSTATAGSSTRSPPMALCPIRGTPRRRPNSF